MVKFVLAFMLISSVVVAGECDSVYFVEGRGIVLDDVWFNRTCKKDTTLWYIKEIKEKCDTTFLKAYQPSAPDLYKLEYTREIKCRIDTTWAEKVVVRLRPEELSKLMKILSDK